MVYIYKKLIGNKPYYYLRASERKGNKVIIKDIAYLGNSIEAARKALNNPRFKDRIRKAYKTIHNFIESNHYLEKVNSLKLKSKIQYPLFLISSKFPLIKHKFRSLLKLLQ